MGGRGGKGGGGGGNSSLNSQLTQLQQDTLTILGGPNSAAGKKFLGNIAYFNQNNPTLATGTYGLPGGGGSSSSGGKGTASASTGGVKNPQGGGKGGAGSGGGSTTPVTKTYKPSFDTSKVDLKPGTGHTPNIGQSYLAKKLPDFIFDDRFAPVGSAENPHVFNKNATADWQTFGAMHTNQDKAAWDDPKAWQHAYDYTAGTFEYNRGSAPDAGSPLGTPGKDNQYTLGLDAAFRDSAVKPLEEHVILVSSQNNMFFAGAIGTPVSGGTFSVNENMDGDDILNELDKMVNKEFIYTNFLSTAIPVDQVFNEHSRNIRLLIKMKPGQKAVYVSGNPVNVPGNKTLQSKPISAYNTSEKEMILPRNQTIRILDVLPTTDTGSNYEVDVIVEIVDQPNV